MIFCVFGCFLLYSVNSQAHPPPYIIADSSYPINSKYHICCAFLERLSNVSLFKSSSLTNGYIHVSPRISSFARIISELQNHHYLVQASDAMSNYNIISSQETIAGSVKIGFIDSEFSFLSNLTISYNIYSLNCFSQSTKNVCEPYHKTIQISRKNILSPILYFIFLFTITFILFQCLRNTNFFDDLVSNERDNFWVFDENMRPILKPENEDTMVETRLRHRLKLYSKDKITSQSSFYKLTRGKKCGIFHRIVIFPLKNKFSLAFTMIDSLPYLDKINVEVNFQSDHFNLVEKPVLTMNSYRNFRPFEINLSLNTRTSIIVGLPIQALEPFHPNGHIDTFLSSLLLLCSRLLNKNPSSNDNFKKLWDRCSKVIGAKRVMIQGTITFYEMNTPDIPPLTKEDKIKVMSKFPQNRSILICKDLLPNCECTFIHTITNAGMIMWFALGFDHQIDHDDFTQCFLPLVIQTCLYVFHISYASEKSLKYAQLEKMKIERKGVSIFEVDASLPIQKVLSKFTSCIMGLKNIDCEPIEEEMSSLIDDVCEMYHNHSKVICQKIVTFSGIVPQVITISSVLVQNKYTDQTLITTIMQDIKEILQQENTVLHSSDLMEKAVYDVFKLGHVTMIDEPSFNDETLILNQLGYNEKVPFMSILHPDDVHLVEEIISSNKKFNNNFNYSNSNSNSKNCFNCNDNSSCNSHNNANYYINSNNNSVNNNNSHNNNNNINNNSDDNNNSNNNTNNLNNNNNSNRNNDDNDHCKSNDNDNSSNRNNNISSNENKSNIKNVGCKSDNSVCNSNHSTHKNHNNHKNNGKREYKNYSDIAQSLCMGKNRAKKCAFAFSVDAIIKYRNDILKNPQSNLSFGLDTKKCLIRLIAADKSQHYYGLYSACGIGCLFNADQFVLREEFPRNLFHYSSEPENYIFWAVDIETQSVMPLFGMPTIWEELMIDKMTKFSMFRSFIHESCRFKFEENLEKLLTGEISSWIDSIRVLRIGGAYQWFLLAIYASSSQLHCALLNMGDEYDVNKQMKQVESEKQQFLEVGKTCLFRFRDDNNFIENIENFEFDINQTWKINWNFVHNQIPEKFRKDFAKRMTNAFEYGHIFEMDIQININGPKWISMRGKPRSPTEVVGVCIDISEFAENIETHLNSIQHLDNCIQFEIEAIQKNAEIAVKAKSRIDEIVEKISMKPLDSHQKQILESIINGANRLTDQMKSISIVHTSDQNTKL